MNKPFLYVFLDEAGNFDFSPTGTKYFILSAVSKIRPFPHYEELTDLKYELIEDGRDIEYFHASEDSQMVRNRVFEIIHKHLSRMRIDSIIVEKRKTGLSLRSEEKFYPKMMGYLLRYILENHDLSTFHEVIVITDRIPVRKKEKAITKAIKIVLVEMLPENCRYRVLHHDSKSNFNLQIADYCSWAIYKKWNANDERSHSRINTAVKSEFEIFKDGKIFYY